MIQLDKIDVAILQIVQRNSRLTSEELGSLVNLSPSACQRRLKRLRSEGIIEAEVAIIAPRSLGRTVSMIVMITLERDRIDIIDKFRRWLRETREIMIAYCITGDADYLLVVTAKDMEDYSAFTRRYFHDNPDIRAFKTMVVMDRIKASFEFPIDVNDWEPLALPRR
jgi:Lrp/AsnC family transcriptional regulator, leucine-responsive regulatory protein